MGSTGNTSIKKQVVRQDLKVTKIITGKNQICVVLKEGLLFLAEQVTARLEERFVTEPVESLVTV